MIPRRKHLGGGASNSGFAGIRSRAQTVSRPELPPTQTASVRSSSSGHQSSSSASNYSGFAGIRSRAQTISQPASSARQSLRSSPQNTSRGHSGSRQASASNSGFAGIRSRAQTVSRPELPPTQTASVRSSSSGHQSSSSASNYSGFAGIRSRAQTISQPASSARQSLRSSPQNTSRGHSGSRQASASNSGTAGIRSREDAYEEEVRPSGQEPRQGRNHVLVSEQDEEVRPSGQEPRQEPQHRQRDARWGDIMVVAEDNVRTIGLIYVHYTLDRQNVSLSENDQRFIDHYGTPPAAVAAMINDLTKKYPDTQFKDVLMTLNWLKSYGLEREIAGGWGYGCLKDVRTKCRKYTKRLASLADDKIVFGGFEEGEDFLFGIDTVHFNTNEFRLDPSSKWYNFKSNCAGLKYEIAMSIRRAAIVWIRGPFPASVHDITIFRGGKKDQDKEDWDHSALYFRMQDLGVGIGDSGYAGEPTLLTTKQIGQSKAFKTFMDRVLQREESLHNRMKGHKILGTRFRHGVDSDDKMNFHGLCVSAISVMIQYDFETGRPPMQVR